MNKCSACGKFLSSSGAALCTSCPLIYHKGCVSIAETSNVSKNWSCPECKSMVRTGERKSTPLKAPSPSTNTVPGLIAGLSRSDPSEDERAMKSEIAEYMEELREFRKEMIEFRASVAGIGRRLDGIENRLDALEQRDLTGGSKKIGELESTIAELKLELNERDQETLLSDLDIGGIPETMGENTTHTIIVLAAKLGVKIEDKDIVFAERVGLRGATVSSEVDGRERVRRVIVRLARRHLRDELLQAARVRRNMNSADAGFPGPTHRIYINERLTRNNRQIFYKVREECRKHSWRYFWTKKGRIFIRQSDGKQAFTIRSISDIVRIFESRTV